MILSVPINSKILTVENSVIVIPVILNLSVLYPAVWPTVMEESRTPEETQSELTRLSDFLIIAWLKFTKLLHCWILFIKNCLCYVFRKPANTHTKLKLENYSSVLILTAFVDVLDFTNCCWHIRYFWLNNSVPFNFSPSAQAPENVQNCPEFFAKMP